MTNREWLNKLSNEDFVHLIIARRDTGINPRCGSCVYADEECVEHDEMTCYEGCVKWLEQEHKIDAGKVKQVRCGRWERRMSNIYACSECTNEVTYRQSQNYSFCPYCGAVMRGEENDKP